MSIHPKVHALARELLRDYRLDSVEREQEVARLEDALQSVVDISLAELEERRGVELL
jgi:hypothetical protein